MVRRILIEICNDVGENRTNATFDRLLGYSMICKNWFQSEVGQLVLRQEQLELVTALPDCWLSNALQIGMPAASSLLAKVRSMVRLVLATDIESDLGCADLIADPVNLPLDNQSVELVVLHHALETSPNPHAVLREARSEEHTSELQSH